MTYFFGNSCKSPHKNDPPPFLPKVGDFDVFGEISSWSFGRENFSLKKIKNLRNIGKNGPFSQKIPPPKKT